MVKKRSIIKSLALTTCLALGHVVPSFAQDTNLINVEIKPQPAEKPGDEAAKPAPKLDAEEQQKLNSDLVYEAYFGKSEKVIELIEKGANPHALNNDGVPAMSLAATRKNQKGLDVMKALLASRANINQPDQKGQTPLFHATRVGNLDAVKLLLSAGADLYHKDKKGDIARTIAYQQGYMDVFEYMDAYVKDKNDKVLKAYEDRGKEIAEKEKDLVTKLEEQKAKEKALAEEKELVDQEKEAAEAATAEALKVLANQKLRETSKKIAAEDEDAFKAAVRQLSYHACSRQYWDFVLQSGVKSELSVAELSEKIEEHVKKIQTQQKLLSEYGAGRKYLGRIIAPSQNTIFQELEAMGSNITRSSHGVGNRQDAINRCGKFADSWVIKMPE